MSVPQNPLNAFDTYSSKHILVAFKYTKDAEQTNISPTMGDPGTVITGKNGGPGIVIANDFTFSDFSINAVKWTSSFYGPLTATAGSCVGYIEITDRTGLYFTDFMKTQVIAKLGISEGHIVFALRTFFIGENTDGINNDVIAGNPLLFNMATSINDLAPKSGRFYTFSFVGASTTYAQLNQYSKIYQMTITNSDSNLYNQVPKPDTPTCSLQSRQAEDAAHQAARKARIDLSKPMRTLGEVFSAFESELNTQKFTNSAQLQSWLQHVNDGYTVKIIPPTQQKKGGIPVDFFVVLDPAYKDYPIDNRNLPFEQPEIDQNKNGIRSFAVKTGMDVPVVVEKLMKLSRKVGQEAQADVSYIFKTAISTLKTNNDRYQIYVVIKRIQVPVNSAVTNTGPGDSAITPLEFTFQDPTLKDRDIISLNIKVAADTSLSVLEQQLSDTNGLVVYGDREQITAERLPNIAFFNSQYSGLRAMINPYENYGLEWGTDAAKIDNNINVNLKQQTKYSIIINGNPHLLSDMNRLPSDVATQNVGNAHYYKFTELEPMYVKLKIFLKTHAAIGVQVNEEVANTFYYNDYLFMYRVTNIFDGGAFMQQLDMLKTDGTV